MSDRPFMPLWNGDLLADTLDLDASEVGAYILLIIAQWQRKGASLPSDPQRLQRIARCGRNWPRVWARISEYFDTDEEGIFNSRCRILSRNAAAKSRVNSQNGERGGHAKALKNKKAGLANAIETPERNGWRKAGIPEPEPEEKEREPKGSPKKSPRGSRLKPDWVLPKAWGDWALEQGMTVPEVRFEADRFRDYWISVSGAKAAKADWEAVWRNWIRRVVTERGESHAARNRLPASTEGGQRSDPAVDQITRLVLARQASGQSGAGA